MSKTESRSAGAARIQSRRNCYKSNSDCPRNPTNIQCDAKPCQRSLATGFPDDFQTISTSGKNPGKLANKRQRRTGERRLKTARNHMRLPLTPHHFRRSRYGRPKIEKRTLLTLEVLALKVPFGVLWAIPSYFSESSPVAGTIENFEPVTARLLRSLTT